jgi:hypothetical protein
MIFRTSGQTVLKGGYFFEFLAICGVCEVSYFRKKIQYMLPYATVTNSDTVDITCSDCLCDDVTRTFRWSLRDSCGHLTAHTIWLPVTSD